MDDWSTPQNGQNKQSQKKPKKPIYKRVWFWIIIAVVVICVGSSISGGGKTESTESTADVVSTEVKEPKQEEQKEPDMTIGQKNAVKKANDYLKFTAFSRSGLINQLEFEGFSTEDATFAVDYIAPDWNEQAAKKAEDYLDMMAFSRDGLIQQLEFEGFTQEQAAYGVTAVGY